MFTLLKEMNIFKLECFENIVANVVCCSRRKNEYLWSKVLYGIIHLPFLELSIIIFRDYQDENKINLRLVRQQYRACWFVQSDLTLYWWQRLITFDSSKKRVNEIIHFQSMLNIHYEFAPIKEDTIIRVSSICSIRLFTQDAVT